MLDFVDGYGAAVRQQTLGIAARCKQRGLVVEGHQRTAIPGAELAEQGGLAGLARPAMMTTRESARASTSRFARCRGN